MGRGERGGLKTYVKLQVFKDGDAVAVTLPPFPDFLAAYRFVRAHAKAHAQEIGGFAYPDRWNKQNGRGWAGLAYTVDDASEQPDCAWILDTNVEAA